MRLENHLEVSPIKAILSFTGDKCGTIGPHFIIQYKDWNQKQMARDQLADFLNDASGIDSGLRLIDESVEKGLFSDFSDVLSFESGRYVYKGPSFSGPSGFFSSSYKKAMEEVNNENELLNFANSKADAGTYGRFLSAESYALVQGEFGITSIFSTKPIIGSCGAGPCIIIAIWNASTKEAILAHVDECTTFSSIELLFKIISSCESDRLEVHMHGGNSTTKTQAAQIVGLVKSKKNSELVSANLCKGYDRKSLAIDSRTGKTLTAFSVSGLQYNDDFDVRIKTAGLRTTESPLNLVFDGRSMIQKANLTNSLFSSRAPKVQENYCGFKPGFLLGNGF